MSDVMKSQTCQEQDLEQVQRDLNQRGFTVTGVERIENKEDNSTNYRVTGKNFDAKLGYADREFVD